MKHAALETEVAEAQSSFANSLRNLELTRAELENLGEPKDTSELEGCLERASELGKLEQRISDAQEDIIKLT